MDSKKGGSKNKLERYPRIGAFLEDHNEDVYDIINDLGAQSVLTPARGTSGVTFLLPDASYVKEIKKIIGSNPEAAVDIILSLTLRGLFKKPEDFTTNKAELVTALGTKLVVKSVAAGKVLIEDGELTVNKAFHPFERYGNARRDNMAVWDLLKGKVQNFEGLPREDSARKKAVKPEIKPKTGGCDNELERIICKVFTEEVSNLFYEKKTDEGKPRNSYLCAVTRILRVFEDKDPTCYLHARCILTGIPFIDFYLLVINRLIFPSDIVCRAYNEGVDSDKNADTYLAFFTAYTQKPYSSLADPKPVALDSARAADLKADLTKMREGVLDRFSNRSIDEILKKYDDMDKNNALAGVCKGDKIYPESLAKIFAENTGLHLLIDEFCALVFRSYLMMEAKPTPADRAQALRELHERICGAYHQLDNPKKQAKIGDLRLFNTLNSVDYTNMVKNMWKTFAFHVFRDASIEGAVVGGDDDRDGDSVELTDVDMFAKEKMGGYDNCPICLSNTAKAELRAYIRSHGKLPDDY